MTVDSERLSQQLIEALRGVLCQVADPNVVLRAILDQAVAFTKADRGLFVEVAEHGDLAYRVLHGFEPRHLEGQNGRFSRNLFQRVLDTGNEILIPNALDDPFYREIKSVQALRARAILCVPIRTTAGIAAIVHLENRHPGHFRRTHVELLRRLVEVAGPVLESLRAGREMIRERDRLRLSETQYRSEAEETRRLLASEWSFGRFVGRSAPVRNLEDTVRKAAATDFPILILGETGTGKSIVARVLHYCGPRTAGPLVTVFCPSLERSMVEPELFGHKRGAFTGAVSDRLGKVPAAEKGTLFLDEIGEMPLEIQPKLLRLLQERTYERIGEAEERRADVRVIAATNRDLEAEVREGRFRRDLFERLHYIPIRIPPLRERVEDIPLLLRHCLDQTDSGRWVEPTSEVCDYLKALAFSWPGNVRHLEQLAARLTMEGRRGAVRVDDVVRLLGAGIGDDDAPRASSDGDRVELDAGLPRLLEAAERKWIEEAIRRYPDLTRAEVAAKLKISESAFYKKLRHFGLGGPGPS